MNYTWQKAEQEDGSYFFYDRNLHGLDLKAAEMKYQPYLASVSARSDLTYLFQEMLGIIPGVGFQEVRAGNRCSYKDFSVTFDPAQFGLNRDELAQALAANDSVPAAAEQFRKIVEVEPQNAKALRGLAWCRLLQAQYAEAVKLYRDATTVEPDNADGWAGLGSASLGAGDLDGAQRALEKGRAIDPENVAVKKGFELLQRARKGNRE